MRRLTAFLLLAFAAAGCGDEEKQIRATLTAHQRALEHRDFGAACALRTAAAQRGWFCPRVDPPLANEPIVTFTFKTPEITEIDVDGDTAEVRYASGEPTRLRKVDGKWLLDTNADKEERAIRAALETAEQALRNGDLEQVCSLMTPAGQRAQIKDGINPHAKTCVEAFEPEPVPSDEGFQTVQGLVSLMPPVTDVVVTGDRAEVRHASGETTRMRKLTDLWLVDGP